MKYLPGRYHCVCAYSVEKKIVNLILAISKQNRDIHRPHVEEKIRTIPLAITPTLCRTTNLVIANYSLTIKNS